MSVLGVGVDVLVREVYTAVERSVTVYHKYLAVIAVIHFSRPDRLELIEYSALYPFFLQHGVIFVGEGKQTAEVVVYYPYVNAVPRLSFKYLKDRVPHLSLLDNEVFQEDKALRLFKLLQQTFKLVLAERKVGGGGICVDGVPSVSKEIIRLFFGNAVLRAEPLHNFRVLRQQELGFLVETVHSFAQAVSRVAVPEKKKEHRPEDRHHQYRDYPGDLVARIYVRIYNIDSQHHAQNREQVIGIGERRSQRPEEHHKISDLYRDPDDAHYRPIEYPL